MLEEFSQYKQYALELIQQSMVGAAASLSTGLSTGLSTDLSTGLSTILSTAPQALTRFGAVIFELEGVLGRRLELSV